MNELDALKKTYAEALERLRKEQESGHTRTAAFAKAVQEHVMAAVKLAMKVIDE